MATTSRFVAKNGLDNNSKTLLNIGTSGSELSFSGGHLVTFTSTGTTTLTLPTTGTLATTGDIKDATLTLGVSGVGLSGSANFSANTSSNATFTVTSNATSANTVSTIVSRDTSGNFSAGTITASLDGNATNVTGTVAIVNGGTGATSATSAITNLGATTVGANLFKLTDPSATTFIRINSANTVSTRTAAEFRSDLGATTVGSALFTLSNPGSTSFIRINADNTVTAQSASSYRSDLGANTVGSNIFTLTNPSSTTFIKINSDNTVTARSASEMRTDLGATSLGSDFFTLSTSSTSYIQITSTGSINLLNASNFRTAIGAGTGTVTSVDLSMPSIFSVSNNPVTTSGTLTVSLANQTANTVFAGPSTGSSAAPTFRTLTFADVTDTLTVGKGGTGTSSLTSNSVLVGNGTSSVTLTSTSTQYKVFVSGSGGAPTWGSVSLDQAAAISGKLPLEHGGTNATTAAEALTNLGALSSSTSSTQDGYFGNIYLQDDTSPSNYLQITNFDNLTASRTLKINCNDADKSLTISADSTISGTNTGDQTITLTGDVTGSGTSSFAATLATSGVTSGTYNNSTTAITPFTVDSKGRITSTSTNVTITPAFSSLTSKPTTLSGYGITDALSNSTSSTQSGYFGELYLYDTSTPSNYLKILNVADLTATRTLSINTGNSNRTLTLDGDSTISGTNTGDQTITLTGDVTGSGTSSFAATLATSGVTAGTYNNSTTAITPFTVDSKGRITSTGVASTISPAFSSITSKPTTLSGYGITDALSNSTSSTQNAYFGNIHLQDDTTPSHYLQITDAENLTADRILSLNVNDANRTISLSGNLTVSTSATISGTNTGDQTITLTGDVTGTGTSSFAATLATSGVTAGTYNNSTTAITPFTVDAKGRITSTGVASTISPAFSSITSKPTTLSGYGITDALSNSTSSTQNAYFGNIHLQDDTTPSNYLQITDAENLTADRILSLNVNDANRTISLSGNLTVSTSATISGTNTGDQTITLTGDVTGSGTGSFSATIGSQAVTFAKIVNSGTTGLSVVGRSANSAGSFDEISAASDGQILRRSGNAIAFGNINLSSSNAVGTTILNVNNGGIGTSTASANNVFAGPTTGSATTPAFRALVAADIPSLNYAPQTTGTSLLYGNNAGGFSNATVSTGLSFSGGTLSNTGVTSVGLSLPNIFTVSTSTVTTTGTLTATLSTTSANNVFAGPTTGSATTPAFRALVAADIPNLDANKITTGTIATARLASGTAASTSYLRGDQTWATITATSPAGGSGSLQYNNAGSFGGAAYARWNSTNNSLWLYAAPTATTLSAVLQMGAGFTDEVPAIGDFAGSANGTILASNIGTSFTGNQVDFQVAGSNIFKIDSSGNTTIAATTQSTSTTSGALKVSGGVGIVKNVYVGGNMQVGSGTFTRASTNDIILDNSSTSDTPGVTYYYGNNTNMGTDVFSSGGTARFRIVKNLNETGGAELWSVNVNGIVTRTAWAVGETIKTQTYIWSDMSMSSVSDPTSVTSSSYTTIATASYTPLSSSSYLWIEFSATYDYLNGTSADEFAANIEVGGTEIINVFQKFINGSGGGGRSGVLFPLSGRYTNAGTSSLTITVRVKRNSGDDPIRVFGNAGSGLMRIQEIGR